MVTTFLRACEYCGQKFISSRSSAGAVKELKKHYKNAHPKQRAVAQRRLQAREDYLRRRR